MLDITDPLPSQDSFAGVVIAIISLSGEMSIDQTKRLTDSASYQERAVKRMRADRLIRTYYKDGLRGLRLTAAAKRSLLQTQPTVYAPFLCGSNTINAPKYDKINRTRLQCMSEVLVTMHNADVIYYPSEKPAIFQMPRNPLDIHFDFPTYYTALEIKAIGPERKKISGSRATGALLTEDAIYAIYNAASMDLKWKHESEWDFARFLETELRGTRLYKQYWGKKERAIAFASDMDRLSVIMGHSTTKDNNYFLLDNSFEHFHFLTSDARGERILTYIYDSNKRNQMNAILSSGLLPRQLNSRIPNDGFDPDGTPVLFAYTCDVPSIYNFSTALDINNSDGILLCFKFQAEAIRSICGSRVKIREVMI